MEERLIASARTEMIYLIVGVIICLIVVVGEGSKKNRLQNNGSNGRLSNDDLTQIIAVILPTIHINR